MDHYSAERWLLERHRTMAAAAERRSRLDPPGNSHEPARAWMARGLRALADRLEGAPARTNLTPPRVTG